MGPGGSFQKIYKFKSHKREFKIFLLWPIAGILKNNKDV